MGYFPEAGYLVPVKHLLELFPAPLKRELVPFRSDNWDLKCFLDTLLEQNRWPEQLPRPDWFYCVAGEDLDPSGELVAGEVYAVYSPDVLFEMQPRGLGHLVARHARFRAFAQWSDTENCEVLPSQEGTQCR